MSHHVQTESWLKRCSIFWNEDWACEAIRQWRPWSLLDWIKFAKVQSCLLQDIANVQACSWWAHGCLHRSIHLSVLMDPFEFIWCDLLRRRINSAHVFLLQHVQWCVTINRHERQMWTHLWSVPDLQLNEILLASCCCVLLLERPVGLLPQWWY